jgi:hypothetical protein
MGDADGNTFNKEDLENALQNDENSYIMNLTTEEIETRKMSIFIEMGLNDDQIHNYLGKLNDYVFVDEIPDIKHGSHIRWIPLRNNDSLKMKSGAVVCDVQISLTGSYLLCKNFRNALFKIKLDDNIIFRQLSQQEQILLTVMNYLQEKNANT